ncbi:MAG: hypothetical protein HKN75_08250 [Bacteroidia bacterium]|nr:hypothetical protein [Bacteroidia bacterium]
MKKLFALVLTFIFIHSANAQQLKSFTKDQTKFIDELESKLKPVNKKKTDALLMNFLPYWNGGKFTPAQQTEVYNVADAMLKKRLAPFPDFSNYIEALIGFSKHNHTSETFIAWHKAIIADSKGSSRKFKEVLKKSNNLFNHQELYRSNSVVWKSDSYKFKFVMDDRAEVHFSDIKLVCISKRDSSIIYNTSGVLLLSENIFIGNKGKILWTRAGESESEVYADIIAKYRLELKSSNYVVDSVAFHYKNYFAKPLVGKVEDKILANVTEEKASYPRFSSYGSRLEIKELVKDAIYQGGFSVHGGKMLGTGGKDTYAYISFHREGKPFLKLASKNFAVRTDRISSRRAAAIIYMDEDSLYHAGLEFSYNVENREVVLTRNTKSGNKSPFISSFHKYDIHADELKWKIDDPIIDMKMSLGAGESKMVFESQNYYRKIEFARLQGIASQSPLYTVKKYAEKTSSDVIYAPDFAKYLRMSEPQARKMLITLSDKGFLEYNEDTDEATFREKLYFYLNASLGNVDYDVIKFESVISALPNASINLLNSDITVRGVDRIFLSDTQFVYVRPANQELVLHEDRNFSCGGHLRAGRIDFWGDDFVFNYDQFDLDLRDVDSLRMKIVADEPDETGRYRLIPMKSVLQNVTGVLKIDSLINKSSLEPYPQFPTFKANTDSYVYYDHAHIFDGVYDRNDFYFHLLPFTIDSLDNFSPGGMRFDGTFVSSGIFPEMKEQLTIQDDYSFGFVKEIGSEGLALNNKLGKYAQSIQLSHEGLRGQGVINFLSSTTNASKILFFPDSTNAFGETFAMAQKTIGSASYPAVQAEDVFVNWRHKNDEMLVYKNEGMFALYNDQADLDGNLILSSKGLAGNGVVHMPDADLTSNKIDLMQTTFNADTSNFNLYVPNSKDLAMKVMNVNAVVSMANRQANFKTNGGITLVTFPVNQYVAYSDEFKWWMDKKTVDFGSQSNITSSKIGAQFISAHPMQDSLTFDAPLATYNLNNFLIESKGVKSITIADASVIPDLGIVVIEKNAYLRQLQNARILANNTTKFHTITEADVLIKGRNEIQGTGFYSYKDMLSVEHRINLEQIGVDTTESLFAYGKIVEQDDFSISPNTKYKGNAVILADEANLRFDGFAKIDHRCEDLEKNWFSFSSIINPKGVNIPVKDPRNENGEKLFTAIAISSDSSKIYPVFFARKQDIKDEELFSASGELKFDLKKSEYSIQYEPEEQTKQSKKKGNTSIDVASTYTLNDEKCILKGEGPLNFNMKLGQLQSVPYGTVTYNLNNDSTSFELLIDVNFLLAKDALNYMAEDISDNFLLKATDNNRNIYKNALKAKIGNTEFEKLENEMALYGAPKKLPESLKSTIIFSHLKMYWDPVNNAFVNSGPIGVNYLNGKPVNRFVEGHMEYVKKRSGDEWTLMLNVDKTTWYYFNYRKGILQSISSESTYNDAISDVKPDKRIADASEGKEKYQYMLSTDRKAREFKRKFEN